MTTPSELTFNYAVIHLINEYEQQAASEPSPELAMLKGPGVTTTVLLSKKLPHARHPIAKITCLTIPEVGRNHSYEEPDEMPN